MVDWFSHNNGDKIMDRNEVKTIIERDIDNLIKTFGIEHWKIRIDYDRCGQPTWDADILRVLPYNKANITLDHDLIEDKEQLSRSIIHELIHIILAPFDLYRQLMTKGIEDDSKEDLQESALWTYCLEQTVINIEKLYNNIKSPEP